MRNNYKMINQLAKENTIIYYEILSTYSRLYRKKCVDQSREFTVTRRYWGFQG